jgi:hypothetical protein
MCRERYVGKRARGNETPTAMAVETVPAPLCSSGRFLGQKELDHGRSFIRNHILGSKFHAFCQNLVKSG